MLLVPSKCLEMESSSAHLVYSSTYSRLFSLVTGLFEPPSMSSSVRISP